MSDDEFNERLKSIVANTQTIVGRNKPKEFYPTLFLGTPEEESINSILGVPDTVEERHEWIRAFGKELAPNHPDAYVAFLAMEAWSAAYQPEETSSGNYVPPSKRQDRREIILIMGVARDARANEATLPVSRSFWRKRMILGEPEYTFFDPRTPNNSNTLLHAFWDGFEQELSDKVKSIK